MTSTDMHKQLLFTMADLLGFPIVGNFKAVSGLNCISGEAKKTILESMTIEPCVITSYSRFDDLHATLVHIHGYVYLLTIVDDVNSTVFAIDGSLMGWSDYPVHKERAVSLFASHRWSREEVYGKIKNATKAVFYRRNAERYVLKALGKGNQYIMEYFDVKNGKDKTASAADIVIAKLAKTA